MKNWPTDLMCQHARLIEAICDDALESGSFSLDGPKTARVAEINRQVNQSRECDDDCRD